MHKNLPGTMSNPMFSFLMKQMSQGDSHSRFLNDAVWHLQEWLVHQGRAANRKDKENNLLELKTFQKACKKSKDKRKGSLLLDRQHKSSDPSDKGRQHLSHKDECLTTNRCMNSGIVSIIKRLFQCFKFV